jgi:type I restriction enzyme S subunit
MAEALFREWFVEPCKDGLPDGWMDGKLPDEFDFTMGQSPIILLVIS